MFSYIEANIKNGLKGDIKLIKKINQVFSAILAACVLFTSVPVSALSAGETNTEQQTLDELNTENKISTEESNATSTEVATDSNTTEEASISERATLYSEELSSNDIDSSEEELNNEISLQNDNTEDGEEPSNDNWELSTVFYDSAVNNGKTPLTSINWDASDIDADKEDKRVITQQIKYQNSNTITNYNPGDVEIVVPNLTY